MKKYLENKFSILNLFLFWRVILLAVAFFSVRLLPLFSNNFLAGRIANYVKNPTFWGWANFDGEHYLSIAMYGYKDLQQAFFPLYPFLIKLTVLSTGLGIATHLISALVISNLSFLVSIYFFYKIALLDFSQKEAKYAVLSLLVFPTSFYFGAVYTESLFLLLSLLTYYFYRKEKYLISGIIGILMTLTRVYGVFVLIMIIFDLLQKRVNLKEILIKKIYFVFLGFLGIISYMIYTFVNYSDPLAFYNLQTLVGQQRQKGVVLLPQVFIRYIKIFIFSKMNWFLLQTTFLEVVTGVIFTILPIYSYIKKINWGYIVYILFGFLIPSIQGSFSSIPRYVLVIFPAFFLFGVFLSKLNKNMRFIYFLLSGFWLMLNTALFIRGYWVS